MSSVVFLLTFHHLTDALFFVVIYILGQGLGLTCHITLRFVVVYRYGMAALYSECLSCVLVTQGWK